MTADRYRYSFTLPLPPTGKGRARAFRVGAGIRMRTPKKTRSFEGAIALAAAAAGVPLIDEGPVRLTVRAVYGRTKDLAKVYKNGEPKHPIGRLWNARSTPDLDNVVKAVADGLSSCWRDDRQVAELRAVKVYAGLGRPPCVEVEIERIAGLVCRPDVGG